MKPWERDELILAINLYCKTPFGRIHVRNPEIIELATLLGRTPGNILEGKTKEAIVKLRVNQHFFRKMILAAYNSKCCITGLPLEKLLVASHIVPWAKDSKNRLNPQNGLCLNALHDKAFDSGLLTIDESYHVVLSKEILALDNKTIKLIRDTEGVKISFPNRFMPRQDFLQYHRENIFIG